uniref:Uncharacterized protein n=1 Tax=Knipowitschia caucasica TaxID=637954 RepID=A0AAV2IUR9_KNICA
MSLQEPTSLSREVRGSVSMATLVSAKGWVSSHFPLMTGAQPVFVSGANKPNKLLGLTSSHFESDSVRSMVRLLFLRWIIATALRPTAITF